MFTVFLYAKEVKSNESHMAFCEYPNKLLLVVQKKMYKKVQSLHWFIYHIRTHLFSIRLFICIIIININKLSGYNL